MSRSTTLTSVTTLAIILTLAFLSLYQLTPPTPVPANAPLGQFSAERAMKHANVMNVGPHWTGSPGNAQVRDYLVAQLTALGLETQIQTVQVVSGEYGTAGRVENVIARLPGSNNTKAILFDVHYDAVGTSPGGSYAAYTGSFIELARALKAAAPLQNDVIFIFTDGEEWGLLGAKGFKDQHAWMENVGLVVEGIPRGTGGPVFLATTGEKNGWLAQEFIKAVPYPLTYSLARDAYAALPGGGDFDEYEERATGFMLTWQKGQVTYHAMTDNVQAIEPASVQHLGSYLLALARHFGQMDLNTPPVEENRIFFDLFRWMVIQYPGAWAMPLAIFVALVFIAVIIYGIRKKQLNWHGVGLGFAGLLVSLIAAQLLSTIVWQLIVLFINPARVGMIVKIPYTADLYTLGFAALAVALGASVIYWLRGKIGIGNALAGALVWWVLLMFAVTFTLPGGSYLFSWVSFFGAITLAYRISVDDAASRSWIGAIISSVLSVPAVFLVLPVIYILYISLQFNLGVPGTVPFLVALLIGALTLQMDLMMPPATRIWLPLSAMLTSAILMVAAIATSPASATQPREDFLLYALDADTGKASWFTNDADIDEWETQFFAQGAEEGDFAKFYSDKFSELIYHTSAFYRGDAPAASLAAPNIYVLDDNTNGDTRTLHLRITSARGATLLNLFVDPQTTVLWASVDGVQYYARNESRFSLDYWNMPAKGIEVTLQVPAAQLVILTVADQTAGLPPLANFTPKPRPSHFIPAPDPHFLFSDTTWVKKTYTFTK